MSQSRERLLPYWGLDELGLDELGGKKTKPVKQNADGTKQKKHVKHRCMPRKKK